MIKLQNNPLHIDSGRLEKGRKQRLIVAKRQIIPNQTIAPLTQCTKMPNYATKHFHWNPRGNVEIPHLLRKHKCLIHTLIQPLSRMCCLCIFLNVAIEVAEARVAIRQFVVDRPSLPLCACKMGGMNPPPLRSGIFWVSF